MAAISRRASKPAWANMAVNCSRMRCSYSRKEVASISARPRRPCSAAESPGVEYKTFNVSTMGESGLMVGSSTPTIARRRTSEQSGDEHPSSAANHGTGLLVRGAFYRQGISLASLNRFCMKKGEADLISRFREGPSTCRVPALDRFGSGACGTFALRAALLRVHVGEFRAEVQQQRRVVDPCNDDHQRSSSSISGRCDAFPDIEANQ